MNRLDQAVQITNLLNPTTWSIHLNIQYEKIQRIVLNTEE